MKMKVIIFVFLLGALVACSKSGGSDNSNSTGTAPTLVSIAVTPANPSLTAGNTQQFSAAGTYSDSSTKDLTSFATWSTSNPAIATINSAGLASTASAGSTTITATAGNVSGVATLTVSAPESPFALHEVHFNHPSEITALTDLGAKSARLSPYGSLVWDLIEKQKGVYDWSASDFVMTNGYGTGAKLFATVSAQNSLEGTTPGTGQLPRDMSWYLDFLKKAAERYDGDGQDDAPGSPKIDVIQIGNEVDGPAFWQDTPENYALLLKESYKAIKSVAPDIKVAMAGTATPWGFNSFYKPVLAELNRLQDGPGDRYFDIFDLHWSGQFPGDNDYAAITLDKTYELGAYIADIHAELEAIGYDNIPIYITEMSDYSDSPAGYPNHTESYHAAAVVKRYLYALSRGVSKIFWADIIEQHNFGGEVNGYFDNVGLINNSANSDGFSHKKLAYYSYKKMTEMLDGSDWKNIQIINESDDVHIYKLINNNKPVYVAWWDGYTSGATKAVTLTGLSGSSVVVTEAVPTASTGLAVTDYATAFHTETVSISGGMALFSLGETPVFVEVLQ
jgi:hypothetical protein